MKLGVQFQYLLKVSDTVTVLLFSDIRLSFSTITFPGQVSGRHELMRITSSVKPVENPAKDSRT